MKKKPIGVLVYKCFKCDKRFDAHVYEEVFEVKSLYCGKCGEIMASAYNYYVPLVRRKNALS